MSAHNSEQQKGPTQDLECRSFFFFKFLESGAYRIFSRVGIVAFTVRNFTALPNKNYGQFSSLSADCMHCVC